MKPKQAIIDAFERRPATRVPATVYGGGVWTIRRARRQFGELIADPRAYADLIVKTNAELGSPIVYVGSGYNIYLAAAIGGRLVERPPAAPALEAPLVKETADEIVNTDVTIIENDPVIQNIREAVRLVVNAIGDEVVVAATSWGPFTLAGQMYGLEPFTKAIRKKKDEVHKMVDFAARLIRQFYRPLVEERVVPMLALADPASSGDLLTENLFRKFSLPYLQSLIGWARDHGVYTWLHICGDTTEKLESIAESGAHCFSLDAKVSLAAAREKVAGRMALAGNIDPQAVLNQKWPEDVRAVGQACIDTVGAGGFILTSGCDLPPTVPLDNIKAMLALGAGAG